LNVWGNKVKLSIFGESHGEGIGIVIDGLPAGEPIDADDSAKEMLRRSPGRDWFSTTRQEPDAVQVLSGLLEGRTTGAPVCGLIRNEDARSRDYDGVLRPGHADWTALSKFGGYADMRGGGHFSGRLTAPLVFAGSLAKQILRRRGVEAYAWIAAIGEVKGETFTCSGLEERSRETCRAVSLRDFPAPLSMEGAMKHVIAAAKADGDSVGGVVEAVVFGLPGGLGEPFFGSMESEIASLLFSIPAVKGIEFGDGFRLASMRGSQANDALCVRDGEIRAKTNHNGGILGGITNGMPLFLRAAIKPTPSIARPQESVDPATMTEVVTQTSGRHDPCIVPRAVPVVEACLALCALDALLGAPR
jgi:chorismate synthase